MKVEKYMQIVICMVPQKLLCSFLSTVAAPWDAVDGLAPTSVAWSDPMSWLLGSCSIASA